MSLRCWKAKGHDSKIFDTFCVQTVRKSQCRHDDCGLISRSFDISQQMMDLSFTDPNSEANSLESMLCRWREEDLGESNKIHCISGIRSHEGATMTTKRFVTTSPYLCIRFPRQLGLQRVLCGVAVPTYLDLRPYADGVHLPSDADGPAILEVPAIYQVASVNVFHPMGSNGGHYVTYSLIDGVWMRFDDNCNETFARQEHPQAAINKNGVVYYVVYKQVKGAKSLPYDGEKRLSAGHVLKKGHATPAPQEPRPQWPVCCPDDSCPLAFENWDQVHQHIAVAHNPPDPGADQAMTICDRPGCEHVVYHYEFELQAHNRAVHTGSTQQPHTCTLCAKTFYSKSAYIAHTNTCKVPCPICKKLFGDKAGLAAHESACAELEQWRQDQHKIMQREYEEKLAAERQKLEQQVQKKMEEEKQRLQLSMLPDMRKKRGDRRRKAMRRRFRNFSQ